ncbi:MAG TPA: MauE/DoxX family redox-associated membrane protein [Microlunatus sp.]|nr:MauE/DoxX family redox-associated membrane protein [Microlunatus sp.]
MIAPRAQTRRFDDLAPWISTLARLIVGGLLLVAGALKVIDPQSSVAAVQAYQLVPGWLDRPIGWGLPFLEAALGLLLVAGLFTRTAAVISGLLFVVFLVAAVSASARGLSIDCGCFGGGGEVAPGQSAYAEEIIRDLALLALCGWLVWQPRSRFALDHPDLTGAGSVSEVQR